MTWWPHDTKLAHDPVWDAIADDIEVAPCQVASLYERLCDYAVTRGGSIAGFHPALVRRHLGLAIEQIARLIDKLREFDKLVGDLIPALADVARKVTGAAGAATAAVKRTVSKGAERMRRCRARKNASTRQGDLFGAQPSSAKASQGRVTRRHNGASPGTNSDIFPDTPSIESDLEKKARPPFPLRAEGQPPPTPQSGEAPRAYRIDSRDQGQNPRALGTNARAQGVNPRAAGGDYPRAGPPGGLQGEILLPILGQRPWPRRPMTRGEKRSLVRAQMIAEVVAECEAEDRARQEAIDRAAAA